MYIDIQSKYFGDHHVLGDIRLELSLGEVSVLYGPSGCGKSTLLNLIAGLDEKFEGTIALGDARIGMVFQEPRLLPWLTVRQNIELVAKDMDVEGLIRDVGVLDAIDKPCANLSLGMARRVSFARALSVRPDLLVMDEPFVSLDGERAESLRLMVLDLVEKHACTSLFVTHDVKEAVQLGDLIHVMAGSPARVIESHRIDLTKSDRRNPAYLNRFVQTFALS